MTDLINNNVWGTGEAVSINNFGEVVGGGVRIGSPDAHSFIWKNGVMSDLNDLVVPNSGWVFFGANAINDSGQIAGTGYLNGVQKAFLLTPNFSTPSGSDITVQSNVATVTFAGVSTSGATMVTPIVPASAGSLPNGYTISNINVAYDITTTATVSGPITIAFRVLSVNNLEAFNNLRVLHSENGVLVDRTILSPDSPAPDFNTRTIYARVDSLSPFVIARLVNSPPATNIFYLRGAGPNSNPPTLFLNHTAPTATTAKFKDSPAVNFSGGNLWKEIGAWPAASALTTGTLTALSDLNVWLGLKNSDDQGTRFDLRIEVYKNGTLVSSSETYCIQGVTRNTDMAKKVTVVLAPFSPTAFNGTTDVLALKVLTRIGTNGTGGTCGGHSNAVGLRLYFDAVSRSSRFDATF